MCQSCIDTDKQIEEHRKLLQAADPTEVQRVTKLIGELYADRVRKHGNAQE